MQLHELLTETARRFRDGEYVWSQHAMAYHVPDEIPAGDITLRATSVPVLSPIANCFCGVGGILRTLGETDQVSDVEFHYPNLGAYLAHAAGVEPRLSVHNPANDLTGDLYDLMPFINWNDGYVLANVTKDDVIAALERAAALATPPDPED